MLSMNDLISTYKQEIIKIQKLMPPYKLKDIVQIDDELGMKLDFSKMLRTIKAKPKDKYLILLLKK